MSAGNDRYLRIAVELGAFSENAWQFPAREGRTSDSDFRQNTTDEDTIGGLTKSRSASKIDRSRRVQPRAARVWESMEIMEDNMLSRLVSGGLLGALAGAAMLVLASGPSSAFTLSSPSLERPVATAGIQKVYYYYRRYYRRPYYHHYYRPYYYHYYHRPYYRPYYYRHYYRPYYYHYYYRPYFY